MKKLLRLFLTLFIIVFGTLWVQAQERLYTGTVRSAEDGQVVIGASVEIEGTTRGTTTGVDGTFRISAREGNNLHISFLGMVPQTITLGQATNLSIILETDVSTIDEIVAIAYGTARRRDLTGSLSTVDPKLIAAQSNASLTRMLEGAIPGLQVAAIDGQPGQDMGIRIRGVGSASQNNMNPLYVVDGIAYSNVSKNVLSTINPKDVESIVVLKDAASTALYGSRGANGVILVTTKKGKLGQARVTFEGKWGVNLAGPSAYPKTLDSDLKKKYEYAWLSTYNSIRYGSTVVGETNVNNPNFSHEEAARLASQHLFNYNGSLDPNAMGGNRNLMGNYILYTFPGLNDPGNLLPTGSGTSASSTMVNNFLVGTDGQLNPEATLLFDDDWRDYFFQARFRQEYNISVSGATDKVDYYFSGGYLSDPSYLLGSSFDRYNARIQINAQVFKWLKSGISSSYSHRKMQSMASRWGRNAGDVQENLISWLYEGNTLATAYVYDASGNVVRDPATGEKQVNDREGLVYSPLGPAGNMYSNQVDWKLQTELDKDMRTYNDVNASGYAEATFLRDFTLRASVALDQTFEERNRYRNNETGRYRTDGGAMGRVLWNYTNVNVLQTLNWGHDYGKHHVDAILGHEYNWVRWYQQNYRSAQGLIPRLNNFANFIALNTGSGNSYDGTGGNEEIQALEGYFLRANYNYDERYLFSASVRTDGSSKFRYTEDRWGVFWSLGAAWRISNEAWMRDASWINDLKLRLDYGEIGNQDGIGAYSGYQTWGYAGTAYPATSNAQTNASAWSLTLRNAVNEHLTWEKVQTFDIGLDFRLWNRFYGVIDWYQRETRDMLWDTPLGQEMGQTSILSNEAAMRTRGIELELGVDIIQTPDILWSFNVNGTHYKSILTRVPESMGSEELGGLWAAGTDAWTAQGMTANTTPVYLRGEGKPYYNGYMIKYMGIDQASGLPLYSHIVTETDVANNTYPGAAVGTIVGTTVHNQADRVEIGDVTPKFIGGFGTFFSYKNFDFSIQFAFQLGGKFYSHNYGYLGLYHGERVGQVVSSELWHNTWSPESNPIYSNTSAKFPIQMTSKPNGQSRYESGPETGNGFTDMSVFNASYLSVKNITIGYNFPKRWTDRIGIEGIRTYVTLDNMWLITSVSGIDPRMDIVGGFNVGAGAYPYIRNTSFGLIVNF